MWTDRQLDFVRDIAIAAGEEILQVYNAERGIEVAFKADNSPLTEADRRAHDLIVSRLKEYKSDLPILSEESEAIDHQTRNNWERYWLVDPLDGTKEFVKRNDEFTVNIALIERGQATLGVVYVPVSGVTYLGKQGEGAWRQDRTAVFPISSSTMGANHRPVRVVASRSHRGQLVDRLIDSIEAELGETEVVSMGSSLKICLLAEGRADIYPRLAPTSEWDTAAAHAVLAAAGGEIYDTSFKPLRYNQKQELLNPHFLALADPAYAWKPLLQDSLS